MKQILANLPMHEKKNWKNHGKVYSLLVFIDTWMTVRAGHMNFNRQLSNVWEESCSVICGKLTRWGSENARGKVMMLIQNEIKLMSSLILYINFIIWASFHCQNIIVKFLFMHYRWSNSRKTSWGIIHCMSSLMSTLVTLWPQIQIGLIFKYLPFLESLLSLLNQWFC